MVRRWIKKSSKSYLTLKSQLPFVVASIRLYGRGLLACQHCLKKEIPHESKAHPNLVFVIHNNWPRSVELNKVTEDNLQTLVSQGTTPLLFSTLMWPIAKKFAFWCTARLFFQVRTSGQGKQRCKILLLFPHYLFCECQWLWNLKSSKKNIRCFLLKWE